jgi:hypothetical protein
VIEELNEQSILEGFDNLLDDLQRIKPNDRSSTDRYCALVITEVEKAKAVFKTYCFLVAGK